MTALSDIKGSTLLVDIIRKHVVEPFKGNVPGASKRVLIYGPPGTGKTFVASAIAGELGMTFRKINPADDAEKIMDAVRSAHPRRSYSLTR